MKTLNWFCHHLLFFWSAGDTKFCCWLIQFAGSLSQNCCLIHNQNSKVNNSNERDSANFASFAIVSFAQPFGAWHRKYTHETMAGPGSRIGYSNELTTVSLISSSMAFSVFYFMFHFRDANKNHNLLPIPMAPRHMAIDEHWTFALQLHRFFLRIFFIFVESLWCAWEIVRNY